jgi:hypothetical protein
LTSEVDGIIGTEVIGASDSTLVRSGTGTASDPYKLGINLANANVWTGRQTFSTDTYFPGGIWSASGNVGIGTTAPAAKLDVNGDIKTAGSIYYGSLKDWRLVYRDDFNTGATGWSNGARSTCGSVTMLGGYGNFAGGSVYKDFDLTGIPHSEVMVRLTYWFGDSWDGEWAYVKLDNYSVWSRSRGYNPPGSENICGAGWTEFLENVEGTISHTANTIRVTVGSTLDQPANDEWWGIDNVEIWVR